MVFGDSGFINKVLGSIDGNGKLMSSDNLSICDGPMPVLGSLILISGGLKLISGGHEFISGSLVLVYSGWAFIYGAIESW